MYKTIKEGSKASLKRAHHVRLENSPASHVPWEKLEGILFTKSIRNDLVRGGISIVEKFVASGEKRRLSFDGQDRWQEMLLADGASIARGMIRPLNNRGQVGTHSLETEAGGNDHC